MTNPPPPGQWTPPPPQPGQWSPPPAGPDPQFGYPSPVAGQEANLGLAGFWRRLVALIVDSVLLGIVAGIVSALIEAAANVTGTSGTSSIRGSIEFILGLVYFGWMWSARGQTLGYMLMGLRLTRSDGSRIGVGRALIRYILIELSFGLCLIPAIVSAFMVGFGQRKQAIHDLMVDTVVIRT